MDEAKSRAKKRKMAILGAVAVVLFTVACLFHPPFVWKVESSKNFSPVQLALLEAKLRLEYFIIPDAIGNTTGVEAEYDEDSTQDLIDLSIMDATCSKKEEYCVKNPDSLYKAVKKYRRNNIAIVHIRVMMKRDNPEIIADDSYCYAWNHGRWVFIYSGL